MIGTVLSFREGIVSFFGGADLASALMDRTSLAYYLCSWQEAKGFEESMAVIEIPNAYTLIWPLALLEVSASLWSALRLSPWISSIPSRRPDRWRRKISCRRIATQRLGGGSREHAHRGGDIPDTRALHRLRSALRETIEALVDRRPVPQAAVSDLNFFMRSAPVSTRLLPAGTGLRTQT